MYLAFDVKSETKLPGISSNLSNFTQVDESAKRIFGLDAMTPKFAPNTATRALPLVGTAAQALGAGSQVDLQKQPGGQARHADEEMLRFDGLYVPTGQARHADEEVDGLYVPTGQAKQADGELLPDDGLYVPGGHI